MRIFETIKKIFNPNDSDEIKNQSEKNTQISKLNIDDLVEYIANDEKNDKTRLNEINLQIKNVLDNFINNLKDNSINLSKIDINEKKVEEKIKFIVKQNLDSYIGQIELLIDNLKKINENYPQEFILKIDLILKQFHKKSSLNFNKANYLIGKELKDNIDLFANFGIELKKIHDNNISILEKKEISSQIYKKITDLKNINNRIIEINQSNEHNENQIKDYEKIIIANLETINKIKSSKKYQTYLKKIKEKDEKNEELIKEIMSLKSLIDFKKLLDIYHVNKKEMEIINKFKNNFKESFINNEENQIISILEESKLNSENINEKINKISSLKEDIKKTIIEENEIETLENKNKKLENQIWEIKVVLKSDEKRINKYNQEKDEIINTLKEDVKKINIELII